MNEYTSFRTPTPSVPAEFAEIATVCSATDVVIGGNTVLGIEDARSLHAGLSVGRDYSNWIKGRITKYGFQEGIDYEVFETPNPAFQVGHGGRRRTLTYRLTLDMAKELAMVENNETGRLVRRYFIWLEKKAYHRLDTELPPIEFDRWSCEELRTKNATANLYKQVLNPTSALWIMERMGYPIPPRMLLPDWRQSDLWPSGVSVTITQHGRA